VLHIELFYIDGVKISENMPFPFFPQFE